MASTYSTNLALELIGTGDQAGTWGNTTNTNLGTLIEQAISGYVTQAVTTGADTTLTIPNGATGVARNMYIELTGTGGTNTNLIVPANKKLYFIYNNASGAVTVKVSGQTGVSVSATEKKILVSNGTDIVEATSYITAIGSSLTLTTLNATSANITTLSGTTADYTTITGTTIGTTATTQLRGASANITTATGTTFSATNMGAQASTQFQGASANITTITGTTISAGTMGDVATTQLRAASANITTATGTTFSATTMGAQSTTTFLGTSANITTVTGTTISATNMGAQATTQFQAASANITTITGTTGTFTTSSDGAGNLRNIPSAGTAKTTSYTLATTDIGEFVTVSTGGSVTVPNNTFATGNAVSVYNDTTGNVSINISTTTGYVVGTNTNRTGVTLATRGIATILFINPSYCILSGNLT
jgi:hypothetical protein